MRPRPLANLFGSDRQKTDWCDWRGTREEFVQLVAEARAQADASSRIVATPLAEIEMRSIDWLEKPLWQRSAFQLLAGAKGSGKGTYLAGLAARVTKRGENVVFISTEDSAEIDLKPRLVAAGADIDRCYVIQQHVRAPRRRRRAARRSRPTSAASACS